MKKIYIVSAVGLVLVLIGLCYGISKVNKISSLQADVAQIKAEMATSTLITAAQGNQIIIQAAAWNVLLSSFNEKQLADFKSAVNASLQSK